MYRKVAATISKFLSTLLLLAVVTTVDAQACTIEIEPNNEPHLATRVTDRGPETAVPPRDRLPSLCVAGELSGDDQDVFLFRVTEELATQRWKFEFSGIGGGNLTRLDIMELTFLDDGVGVTSRNNLLTLQNTHTLPVYSPEMMLAPGDYYLGFSKSGGSGEYSVLLRTIEHVGRRASGFGRGFRDNAMLFGAMDGEATQEWVVSDDLDDHLWRFELETPLGQKATFELIGPSGSIVSGTTSNRVLVLDNVALAAGEYEWRFSGDASQILFTAEKRGQIAEGVEVEPNNTQATANYWKLGTEMRGTLTDSDWFRFDISDSAAEEYWDITFTTDSTARFRLFGDDGAVIADRSSSNVALAGLQFAAGSYFIELYSRDGPDYVLAMKPGSPPAAEHEIEPNDHYTRATMLAADGQVRGTLDGRDDIDVFGFIVEGEAQLYRIQIAGREDMSVEMLDGGGRSHIRASGQSRTRFDNLLLHPGTHYLRLFRGNDDYTVRLLPLGPAPEEDLSNVPEPGEPLTSAKSSGEIPKEADPVEANIPTLPPPPPGQLEVEPNDDQTRADYLTLGIPRVGTLPTSSDTDFYRFHLAADTAVRVELAPPEGADEITIWLDAFSRYSTSSGESATPTVLDFWLLAGDHYISVGGGPTNNGYYQLRVTELNTAAVAAFAPEGIRPGRIDPVPPGSLPLEITLAGETEYVAAYWHHGQRTELSATVHNTGSAPLSVELVAHAGDVQVELDYDRDLTVQPGEQVRVPITVSLPRDLRDDAPITITVAAMHGDDYAGAQHRIYAACDALPVQPFAWYSVPPTALGLIDVAWAGLGARSHPDAHNARRANVLLDGFANISTSGWVYIGPNPVEQNTYLLAGDGPIRITGIVLNPLSDSNSANLLRDFAVEVSTDGVNFTEVLQGRLESARVDQTFMFDTPVMASQVRLRGLSIQSLKDAGSSNLGEVRVLAEDYAPFGAFDIGNPAVGGHVVWSGPHLGQDWIGVQTNNPSRMDLLERSMFEIVLGFHNSRAAQITALEWVEHPNSLAAFPDAIFEHARVYVNTDSAAGPWEHVADWEFVRDANGVAHLTFAEPIWARYVKIEADKPDGARYAPAPLRVGVIEREADGEYFSILGNWGQASPIAIYEHLNPTARRVVLAENLLNNTMETAIPIEGTAAGTVLVNEAESWYVATIAPGENHLRITLSGEPSIEYRYNILDSSGNPMAYEVERETDAEVVLAFYGDPGEYYIHLYEKPRSIVVSWDTSGSMGPYLATTYAALDSFVKDIDGTTEYAQLLAYNSPLPTWVLPYWTNSNEVLSRALQHYNRRDDSSSSETALLTAMDALSQRDGTRAILLITDAETSSYGYTEEVWRMIEEVQPRIFTFEVNSYGKDFGQRLMQDWGVSTRAFYDNATQIGDLDMGYRRALCFLRRDKQYQIDVEATTAALPGPGTLHVRRPADAPAPAVEVIFDASGSMGVDLPSGEQRIRAAKRAVEHLITDILPEGAPFAMRAFGHVEPVTCNMRLEVPLGPLDTDQALTALRGIELKLLSQTPLAEAILATEQDLAGAGPTRTIILITDGEESCDGDAVSAVKELQSRYDVNIAIMSLGIPENERASFEDLARRTGASYVDVTSFEELQASVERALNPTFDVFDVDGQLVASGTVDGPGIELEMGVYTVRITGGGPPLEYPDVRVPGEKTVTLTFGQ